MIQLIVAKNYLKRAYIWVKNHWRIPFGLLFVIVTWFFYRQKSVMLVDNLKETRVSHKKEVEEMKKVHEKHIEDRQQSLDAFKEAEKKVEQDNSNRLKASLEREAQRKEELRQKEIHEIAEALKVFHKERND
jgi:DNA anti-recombination protein RmuC